MTTELEFVECDTCRSKPGTPLLCRGCLHNRSAINALKDGGSRLMGYSISYRRALLFVSAAMIFENILLLAL